MNGQRDDAQDFNPKKARATTAGRCVPCRRVWIWSSDPRRRLFDARCPNCRAALDQTVVSNLKKRTATILNAEPLFRVAYRVLLRDQEGTYWDEFRAVDEDDVRSQAEAPGYEILRILRKKGSA